MWRIPYWLLVAGSVVAGMLLVERTILSRDIRQERQLLLASQQTAASAPSYEKAWKEIAAAIYQSGSHDAALTELLKRHDISIQTNPRFSAALAHAPISVQPQPVSQPPNSPSPSGAVVPP